MALFASNSFTVVTGTYTAIQLKMQKFMVYDYDRPRVKKQQPQKTSKQARTLSKVIQICVDVRSCP